MDAHLGDWTPRRVGVDEEAFRGGLMGPYRLGHRIRATALGEVAVALNDGLEHVVEVELFGMLAGSPLAGPDGRLLGDIAHFVGLRHRHLSPIIGAGIDGGVPYLVRRHHLGRTLAEVIEATPALPAETAVAIFYGVAEVIAFLADEGPFPGCCAHGGLDARDVFLGFDGAVLSVGPGLQLVRCAGDDPVAADLAAARALARELDEVSGAGLTALAERAVSPDDLVVAVRRAHGEACGQRPFLVGGYLRQHFFEQIQRERAFFGLSTLH